MSEQTIIVHTDNKELFGHTYVNGGGQFYVDNEGNATTTLNVAAECYSHPEYTIPGAKDKKIVAAFLSRSVITADGPYDAGGSVSIESPEMCSVATVAGDGQLVTFNNAGFAICGINTANALKLVLPNLIVTAIPGGADVEAPAPPPAPPEDTSGNDEFNPDGSPVVETPEAPETEDVLTVTSPVSPPVPAGKTAGK